MKVSLKTAWLNREIPLVTKDIFGNKLTPENITVKNINKDIFILVGDTKTGILDDKNVVNYFLQFAHYPKYRKYIINTLHKLDNIGEIL